MKQHEPSTRPTGESRYAKKRMSGKMMYGPGCCGHSISQTQIDAAKHAAELARRRERFDATVSKVESAERYS